jgi:hypothetical protein
MVYLTDLFSSHMGHGSAYPLTVLISRFAFRGVLFSPDGHSQRKFIHIFHLLSFSSYKQPEL